MKTRPDYRLPDKEQHMLKRAVKLEWITLFFMLTIILAMYLTMGASQAMKTAWIEDVLSLIPPLSFLIAMRFRNRKPNNRFPYGYRRAPLLSFMFAAIALLILGLYMFFDSISTLVKQEHATLGHFNVFGWYIWAGWVMIAALIYSVIPPMILGRKKLPIANHLHEKTLHADATMNKADWMTGAAAVFGVLGMGIGWWWADSVAALIISIDVLKDGYTNAKNAVADLMDQRPNSVNTSKALGLPEEIRKALEKDPDIEQAEVRLREEGHVISGELFVVMRNNNYKPEKLEQIVKEATKIDWRLYNLVVMPVATLET